MIIQFSKSFTLQSRWAVAIFDRDNTLIADNGYTYKKSDLRWKPDVIETLCKLTSIEIGIGIVSNQSGVSRGKFSIEECISFNNHLMDEAAKHGAKIDLVIFCPHVPGSTNNPLCPCRKPNTLMLQTAIRLLTSDLNTPYRNFGDKISDLYIGTKFSLESRQVSEGKFMHEVSTWLEELE